MNKTSIKKFAIEARKKLMASVIDRAGLMGITPKECREAISTGAGFAVFKTTADTEVTLYGDEIKYRQQLVNEIKLRGFEAVVEEVAYTWFNRIIAIRFMEVNDYLPTRVRVLSSEKEGKIEPDLLTLAPNVEMEFSDEEREYILTAKLENKLDELFRMLFIKQCQELHKILPELFEKTNDYTEMLLNISFTNKDDVIRMLVDEVEEESFDLNAKDEEGNPIGQVEIIGWLYQYYNTELKDDTFALLKKNVKITKERIPAATQLFTPDWIVRYMVENSLGRLWIEHLKANNPTVDEKETAERFGWKYYLPEVEQEELVSVQLAEIRTSYKDLKPTDILCIDPCMGSGHILIYMFDVLMDIYKSVGYSERDAAFEIVEHNIRGLDIDKRAYQLAYFAIMMKGRGYNRRFFRGIEISEDGRNCMKYPTPMLCAIQESNVLPIDMIKQIKEFFPGVFTEDELISLKYLKDIYKDAREYGAILNVDDHCYDSIKSKLKELRNGTHEIYDYHNKNLLQSMLINSIYFPLLNLILQAQVMSKKYDVVVTNPPYMGSSGMDTLLSEYVKKNYENSKSDMSTVFMEKALNICNNNGYISMINIPVWMFLSSFEKLREILISNNTIINMVHFGRGVFGSDFGSTAFVFLKGCVNKYTARYKRLYMRQGAVDSIEKKEKWFFEGVGEYYEEQINYCKIPGTPIAYWISKKAIENFDKGIRIDAISDFTGSQHKTANNDKYLRYFWEIEDEKINHQDWIFYAKGGEFRKWYGNIDLVVDWKESAKEFYIGNKTSNMIKQQYWFEEGITYTSLSSSTNGFRYLPPVGVFDIKGPSIVRVQELYYCLGFFNSVVANMYLKLLNPTITLQVKDVKNTPIIIDNDMLFKVNELVKSNISISKIDWDSFENSWEFKRHPLIKNVNKISEAYDLWKQECEERFNKMKENEELLNKIFIHIYGLVDLESRVSDKDITVHKANLKREIKSFMSYIVGCILGRYKMEDSYITSSISSNKKADGCNGILISENELFHDDIVNKVVEFVSNHFGEMNLEENLNFIAGALDNKGDTSREVIRNYFLKDFYLDHVKIYKKTPVYWLFDSGKENGFKFLIYMQKYNLDTVGKIRTDYLHVVQEAIENAITSSEYIIENVTSAVEIAKAKKSVESLTKKLSETRIYDQALAHVANQRIEIDLDDGVKVNYEKFQGIEIAQEGKKPVKIDLLAKIK